MSDNRTSEERIEAYIECLHCKKFFTCQHKHENKGICINYEGRDYDGREKNVRKNDN